MSVSDDTAQIGKKYIAVSDVLKATFLEKTYRPYIQSFIDHITSRMESRFSLCYVCV